MARAEVSARGRQVKGSLRRSPNATRTSSGPPRSRARVTVIDKCGQATKGVWWMSWHREATKDVVACDMLRGSGKRELIRRFLNAETRRDDLPSPAREFIACTERTRGTETSKYPEEKKK